MPRGKPTDPKVVEAVQAALVAGMATSEAARRWNLNPRTVERISASMGTKLSEVVGGEGGDKIGAKLVEVLMANAEAMIGIAKIATKEEYLKTQQAGGLAQLYAAFADTSLQLLEAAENAGGDETDPA